MEVVNWDEILIPYNQAVDELYIKFTGLQKEAKARGYSSPIEIVTGRVKSVVSILEKAERKRIPSHLIEEKIEDIAGIRIICRFVEDIGRIVELLRRRSGKDMTIVEERDYITNTKPSGYRSYHLHVRYPVIMADTTKEIVTEIQIRTMAMNFWATIEHSLKYKYNYMIPEDLQKRIISTAEAAFQLDREMGTIRGEIMEAQMIVQRKNVVIDQIIKNINSLYFVAELEKVDELNRQFLVLYNEGNVENLDEFNKQLVVMKHLYKA